MPVLSVLHWLAMKSMRMLALLLRIEACADCQAALKLCIQACTKAVQALHACAQTILMPIPVTNAISAHAWLEIPSRLLRSDPLC